IKTFKIKWLSEFSWLHYDDKKMFCIICVKHKMKNKFVTEGATNISKKSAVKEHVKCKDHIEAEKLETTRIQMESLQNQIFSSDANARHIIIIMRAVYFLSKKDLPLQLLPSIIEIMKESGTPHISDGSITYTNEISGHEFLMVIAKTIEDKIWSELSNAVAFGIMIEKKVLHRKDEGVVVKLSRVCTYPLIVNHCVAHRLALACKDARKEIEIYKEAELLVKKIYDYFKNSCSHIQQLKEIQNFLDCPILKIKRLYEIRWLAWYNAIKNICYEPSFTEQNYDELLMDIYIYSTSIISELKQQFPNRLLFSSMKILNLREWPRDSEDLLCFGDNELEDLLKYY
ncbi:4996_t:CDS:2, partial [Funneliformis geosporum]